MEIFSRRCVFHQTALFILTIGLLDVTAQTNTTATYATTTSTQYPPCVTSCIDENGFNLPTGDYAFCDKCNAFAKCTFGNLNVLNCPLGTVYYDRVLGVCVSDSSVCINDSLSTKVPVTKKLSTAEATTATSTLQQTTGTKTTTEVITTVPAESSTISTMTSLASSVTTTTLLSSPRPTISTAQTSTTQAVSSSTQPINIPSPSSSNTTAYVFQVGDEMESFKFAINLYNTNSGQKMRAGVASIGSVTSEVLSGNYGTWYRFVDVTLAQSTCLNTAGNMGADDKQCPLMDSTPGTSNKFFIARCNFKVRYVPTSAEPNRSYMDYMMCYT